MRVLLPTLSLVAVACGGGVPLMHPAHPMKEGEVTIGAGFSGSVPIAPSRLSDVTDERIVEEGAFSPGLAPWLGGRVGLNGTFDAGLTYTGRSVRIDARSAFDFDGPALSVGLGASGLLPERHDDPGAQSEDISGWHAWAGGLLGVRIGFRHVFAVLEIDAAMHWAGADIGDREVSGQQFAIVPAGAIVGRF